jgi:hypothetical protein
VNMFENRMSMVRSANPSRKLTTHKNEQSPKFQDKFQTVRKAQMNKEFEEFFLIEASMRFLI